MKSLILLLITQFILRIQCDNSFQCSYYSISCSYYSCSYQDCSFLACYGDRVTLSTCSYYSGDTYLSLYSSSYGTLANNDNYCSSGSSLTYTIPYTGCRTYYARQSCYAGYYNSCSGITTVTISSPTTLPTPSPTSFPSIIPTFSPTPKPTSKPSSQPTIRPTSFPTAPTMSPTQLIVADCPSYYTFGSSHPIVCVIPTALCPGDNFTASTCGTALGDTSLVLSLGTKIIAGGDDGCGVVAGGSVLSYIATGTECALYTLSQMCYGSKPCGATTHYSIVRTSNTLPPPKKSSSSSNDSSNELNTADIVGITVGITAAFCIFLLGFGFFAFRLGSTYRRFQEFQDLQEHPTGINMAPVTTNHYPQKEESDLELNQVVIPNQVVLGEDEETKQENS